MNEQHPATQSTATQEAQHQAQPAFDEVQLGAIDKMVRKAIAKKEAAHRKEKQALQSQLDKAASGAYSESDELARLRAERDQAIQDAEQLRIEKRRQQATSRFRAIWRDEGLQEDRQAMADFSQFIGIDDSDEAIVLDHKGKQRPGVSLKGFVLELKSKYPGLSGSGNGNDGSGSSRNSRNGFPKTKADFANDYKAKIEYIKKFGLDAWEKLPSK